MTFGEARLAGFAFLAVTATIAINLFAFQERRANPIETSAITPMSTVAQPVPEPGTNDAPRVTASSEGGDGAPTARAQKPMQPTATPGVSQAEIIRGVQRELTSRGYAAGQPDGIVGLVTRAAIMAYEHDYGLALTAEPSEDLLNRIVLGSAAPLDQGRTDGDVILSADAKAVVQMVVQSLTALGYKPGNDATALTTETRRAIHDFEAAQKLPETGRISAQLVSRLLKLQAQVPAVSAATGKSRQAQR
jgi:peptidoglycan hydrolase-like protein with peptidoglycan-binding domain